jgi:cytochrome c oxidase subunit 2
MNRTFCTVVVITLLADPRAAPARQDPAPPGPRTIDVVARRYQFEPAEIEVGEGETVRLLVRSADGPHGFEIRPLKIKKELPRGADPAAIEFTAPKAGRYPILCSEYCGEGHDQMKGALVVVARGGASR